MGDISYHNKDITSKVFAESMKNKCFKVYGLDIPKIVCVLPTNLPAIIANELRIDNLFLLEDDTVMIVDYESTYKECDKIKYLQYVVRILSRYRDEGNPNVKIRMVVIYTADVQPREVNPMYDAGVLKFETEIAFLSELNSEDIMSRLTTKIKSGNALTDDELMELIVLPLTYRGKNAKKQAIRDAIQLAKEIKDVHISTYALSGIVVFADKFIDRKTSKQVKEWLTMTQVGRLFVEEQEAAVQAAVQDAREDAIDEMILTMFRNGATVEQICKFTGKSREKIEASVSITEDVK